jgi:hypothetical protein
MKKCGYRLTIFIGDVDKSLAESAQMYDPTAFLIDYDNCETFIDLDLEQDTTVYTSLGDLPKDLNVLVELLNLADDIIYCPPKYWSDKKTIDIIHPTDCIQGLTEDLLFTVSSDIEISNLNLRSKISDPVELVDKRMTDQAQLWVAGCSVSHGEGVDSSQRYGYLISSKLNMQCSFLTQSGSSIQWAADQILRSDIRAGDIVIWGMTENDRIPYVHDNELLYVTNTKYKTEKNLEYIIPKKTLLSENTFYQNTHAIEHVINFCEKAQAKLLIIGILTSPSTLRYLANKKQYHHYIYKRNFSNNRFDRYFKDLGTDNRHPGPEQHNLYKEFILNLI